MITPDALSEAEKRRLGKACFMVTPYDRVKENQAREEALAKSIKEHEVEYYKFLAESVKKRNSR